MSDDTDLARPGITSPAGSPGDFSAGLTPIVQPMAVNPTPMPRAGALVQIAGLGNLVQGVRDQITTLRVNGAALQESVAALNVTMQGLKQQIDATHDDLKFEAQTLGNGSGS